MDKLLKFYINGERVTHSADTMPVFNPANAQQVAEVALGNEADVDRAVAAAQSAFDSFSLISKFERLSLLRRIREVTERRFEDLAQAMRLEMGAPITMPGRPRPMPRLVIWMALSARWKSSRNAKILITARCCSESQ